MATTKTPQVTAAEVNQSVVLGSQPIEGLTREQAFDIIESDNAAVISLNSEYFKFDESVIEKSIVFLVTGFEVANLEGKDVPVVKMEDKNGDQFINGDLVFYNSCKRLQQLPAFIRVRYKGKVRGGNKMDYKNFDVSTFAPAK